MADPKDRLTTVQASVERPARFSRMDMMAAGLSLVWLVAVAVYAMMAPGGAGGPLGVLMTLLMVFLPIALIWITVTTLRSVQDLRAEAARLQASVESMRAAYAEAQAQPSVERKLEEIERAAKSAETALATFTSRRDASLSQPSADRKAALIMPTQAGVAEDQPALALGTPAEDLRPPLSVGDFIRALQFPESPEDREGFRALRLALEDRTVARLIRAAQDVLNLLSQDGIFMDDLTPDRARPELWRRFANGERGREIAALGGVRDRSSLALTAGRMRQDTIFRDAAHHFLRQFDRTFSEFERNATDQEVAELAETRTARAFMLLGRVTGTFD